MKNNEFYNIVGRIATKYANLVEERLDKLENKSLESVHDDIRLLGNIASILDKSSNTN